MSETENPEARDPKAPKFELVITAKVEKAMRSVKSDKRRSRRIATTLAHLADEGPEYPSLQSHRFDALDKEIGETVWESWVESAVQDAWRVWWYFGPEKGQITVFLLGPHP